MGLSNEDDETRLSRAVLQRMSVRSRLGSGGPSGAIALAMGFSLSLSLAAPGCGSGPRHFRAIENPSANFRARAATLGDGLPDRKVIPKLIAHLEDRDPMVRLTAHQELVKRTGQDFQFLPWAPAEERNRAVEAWKSWWSQELAGGAPVSVPIPEPARP